MQLSRRSFLTAGGAAAAAVTLSACSAASRRLAGDNLPAVIRVSGGDATIVRLLNRAGYGPRPGELADAPSRGIEAWLESQLDPDGIADPAADLLIRGLNYYHQDIGSLLAQDGKDQRWELGMSAIGRAVYSKRQLYEAMVEFWSDHFNIYLGKHDQTVSFKIIDDRDVIRRHALGKFGDLLAASAHSPAMLLYLDNGANFKERPNENYARELMELHTLSVHGPYHQDDVHELARALTGWRTDEHGRGTGQFLFDAEQHDFGPKTILGREFPAGRGAAEVLDVLGMLAAHPSTARFIATKLARRFVADDPPPALVERLAQTFLSSGGDVKAMLRGVFLSPEFANAPPRLKRPYHFVVSALRALHADVGLFGYRRLLDNWLPGLGQPVFRWPTPDGYPDTSAKWAASLLPRWNFALALAGNRIDGVRVSLDRLAEAGGVADATSAVDFFGGLLFNRALTGPERALFETYLGSGKLGTESTRQRLPEMIALMLSSPAFQWT